MPSPLVTVGMAIYQGEAFIGDAIRSILEGTYPHWELLAVDDCSPDRSADIVRSFRDPRIRLVENEVNLGLVGVRNRILTEADGRYVAWLDQDDLAYPDRLAAQVAYLEAHPDVAVCGSWTHLRTERPDGSFATGLERLPTDHAAIRAAMLFLNPIACNTVMMRRDAFIDQGMLFRPAFGNSLDYDLWSNASDTLRLHNLPEVLGAYRVHGNQTSQGAALETMNAHALQIQVELAERALGITMSRDEQQTHAFATVAPVVVSDAGELARVADWFGTLRRANSARNSFDRSLFDRALARQWTTVVLAASRSRMGRAAAMRAGLSGIRVIGVPAAPAISSVVAGIRRGRARSA